MGRDNKESTVMHNSTTIVDAVEDLFIGHTLTNEQFIRNDLARYEDDDLIQAFDGGVGVEFVSFEEFGFWLNSFEYWVDPGVCRQKLFEVRVLTGLGPIQLSASLYEVSGFIFKLDSAIEAGCSIQSIADHLGKHGGRFDMKELLPQ